MLQSLEFRLCNRLRRLPGLAIGVQLLQPSEPAFAHIADGHPQQETVKQRFQLGLLRQFIRGPKERDQWSLRSLPPVLELTLIHQPQQVVQDRRGDFEGLVEKGELDIGWLPGCDAPIIIDLQSADRDRAEKLLRRSELRKQVDKALSSHCRPNRRRVWRVR
jgi:hypothetical protein